MTALDELHRKIGLFGEIVRSGRKQTLSEAQVRLDFIDPMLRALGWDVGNSRSLNQFDRDVIVEEPIEDGGRQAFPDYTFQTAGRRLFFLEAKRPAVDIAQSASAAQQVRRYTWSAQLPAAVLTDFEELAIYDGRVAPRPGDDARTARTFCLRYDRYLDDWSSLEERLGREAVLAGELARLAAADAVAEQAREPFDRAFLADLDRWRLDLGRALARHNRLSEADLNTATQRLLDRIVFLRVAEARGVQPADAATLHQIAERTDVYRHLLAHFAAADERYNSGLFHLRPERGRPGEVDALSPTLRIPDAALKSVIAALYPPASPYAFSTVPSDILGSVYERFLSKVLTVAGGTVTLAVKPELRKQGGVFYTPPHIVRYMVRTTVARWVDAHRADDLRRLRVCDPACGSGAFLVVAYEAVCDEHVRRYLRRKDTRERFLRQQSNATFTLIGAEKKRILTQCIFGIDIDPAAVEITKLSLLLAMLEGDTREELDRQLALFAERALPDIDGNILCANSLLAPLDLGLADLGAIDALKPLDWEEHPSTAPGFDILIGNPPYVFGEWHHPVQRRVLQARLQGIRQVDLYHAFIEQVARHRRADGYWALIVPDAVLARDDTAVLRRRMLEGGDLTAAHVGQVFAEAAVSCVVLMQGPRVDATLRVEGPPDAAGVAALLHAIPFATIARFDDAGFRLALTPADAELLLKLRALPRRLAELAVTSRGEEFGKTRLATAPGPGLVPCIVGEDIDAFRLDTPRRYIPRRDIAKAAANYAAGKAVAVKTGGTPKTAIDRKGQVTLQSVYNLLPRAGVPVELIAAILNSRVARWYIAAMYTSHKKLFPQVNQGHLEQLPVPEHADVGAIVTAVRLLETDLSDKERAFTRAQVEDLIRRGYGLTAAEARLIAGH
jgi:hypothetical protein